MAGHRGNKHASGPPDSGPDLDILVPPDVYAKWQRACAKLEIEAGRPLEAWECLEVGLDRLLAQAGRPSRYDDRT